MQITNHQKVKTWMVFLFVFIASISAVFYYYQQKTNVLEEKINKLQNKNSQYQYSMEYMNDQSTTNKMRYDFNDWKRLEKIANDFVKKSDGKFKKDWGLFLVDLANRYQIDPYIVYELLRVETGGKFDPTLKGPQTKYGRAYGLSQFMKNTAPWIADMADLKYEDKLLFDPYYSIQLSVVYLDFLHGRYDGNWDRALTAYHRGMYGLEQYIEENGHAKSQYAQKIINKADEHRLIAFNE